MFKREILKYLNQWRTKERRKPLIIRGARQVGKTVAVKLFAGEYFENLIVLNLEKDEVQSFFQQVIPIRGGSPAGHRKDQRKTGKRLEIMYNLLYNTSRW